MIQRLPARIRYATGAALAVGGLLVPAGAGARRVVIVASRDATLFSSSGSYADGGGPALYCGETRFFGSRRALLWFDLVDSIPAHAHIDSVQVHLTLDRTSSGPQVHTLYRVLAPWGEDGSMSRGGGGAPATPGAATWTHAFYDTVAWSAPGGDFVPDASSQTVVGDFGDQIWGSTPELVADVQAWLADPASNYGWILIGNESTTQTTKRFDSRESSLAEARPQLVVDFSPISAVEPRTWTAIKRLYAASPPGTSQIRGREPGGGVVAGREVGK